MPYRIDVLGAHADALDRLVELGALDVEPIVGGGVAAIMPDSIAATLVAHALGRADVQVTPAHGRDDESVWVVHCRPVQVGRLQIVPAAWPADTNSLRMMDGPAFGTGLHPSTALCLEILDEELTAWRPSGVLDVGTGSGVLALAALRWGAPRALALDVDAEAVRIAFENARLNGLTSRLFLVHGGPEALSASWPLVLANILAAPLMEMAPTLAQRVAHGGRLVLSGIRASLTLDVERAYERRGMRKVRAQTRGAWTALIFHASW
jgi:ribosomal protein L11 methyltransferase